jgi:hypothetical protein
MVGHTTRYGKRRVAIAITTAGVELINVLIDSSVHQAEAVRWAHECIAIQAQEVALQHFCAGDVVERAREGSCDVAVAITQAHAQQPISEDPTEWLEGIHPDPPHPSSHGS